MFVGTGSELLHILLMSLLAYPLFVVALRLGGNRTLSTVNTYDLVVTVALGAILGRTILAQDVKLLEGFVAFALLVGLQMSVTWLSVRSSMVRHLVQAEPKLLFHQGHYLQQAMQRERVTQNDILAAIRAQGIAAVDNVEAVVLEGNGHFVAIPRSGQGVASALSNIRLPDEDSEKGNDR